jgi:hypothetical protein
VSEEGREEQSTTDTELGQIWVMGNMRSVRYSEPLRNFEVLVEAVVGSSAATNLDEWRRKSDSVNLGLSQRSTSYSLESAQILEVRKEEIPIKNSATAWFKLHVVAGYGLACDGTKQWTEARRRTEKYAAEIASGQLYAYGAFSEEP